MRTIRSISRLFLLTAMAASCTMTNDEGGGSTSAAGEGHIENRKNKLTPAEYVQYIKSQESGLNATLNESNMQMNTQYEPVDYCMLMETGKHYSKSILDSLRPQYDGGSYFRIDLVELPDHTADSTVKLTHLKGNKALSEYFGYHVQENLSLVQNEDTIPCQMSHFLDYGTANNRMSLLCVFPKLKNADAVVLWNDSVIFNKTHAFQFKKQNLQYINSVNLQL
jgi:hypothetical protein